ncbi:MAG TPA: ABC transporter substrate-binding protein [Acidimicrobiales bacterium]|nr:ABC transporter substrate-binding protein [Acidimicrobiales bacterium]
MDIRSQRRAPRSFATRLLAVLFGISLITVACGGADDGADGGTGQSVPGGTDGQAQGDPVAGGTLVDLQNFAQGNPDHIDPGLSSTIQGSQPGQLMFDGLTETNYQTGELEPMVAESWESNDAGDEWTFQLREGVTFHNGDPVLPSDFKFAWERVVNPEFASEVAYHLDPIVGSDAVAAGETTELEGVVADDEAMTLTVSLQYPYSIFPATTSHLVFSPVPKNVVEALPDQSQWERGTMIGNGPFQMNEPWIDDQLIKLERYDDYWGGLNDHDAYLDAIEFRISSDVDSAFQAFEAGQGQTGYIPPGRFEEALARYPDDNATEETLGVYYFGFNMEDPVVGGDENLPLRQAIALAIDKQAIVDTVYSGSRQVATGHTPPAMPGYEEGLNDIAGAAEPDLDRARELLEEWGGEVTEPIRLNFGAGAGHEPVAQIIQANLEEIGIPSVLDGRDSTTYFKEMREGQGQFLRAGWIWDYVAYDNGLYPLFHTDAIGGDNLVQYSNPEFDQLVNDARSTLEEDEANELYREAEKLMLDDVAVVPLNWYTGSIVYDDSVQNLIQSPLQFVAYEEIWLEQ